MALSQLSLSLDLEADEQFAMYTIKLPDDKETKKIKTPLNLKKIYKRK